MAATTVLNYLPRKSPVHALTGATKLAFFLLFTFASMVTYCLLYTSADLLWTASHRALGNRTLPARRVNVLDVYKRQLWRYPAPARTAL